MRYLTYDDNQSGIYPVCLLVPQIRKDEIAKAYLAPYGLDPNELLAIELHQAEGKKKTPVAEIKTWIQEELLQTLADCQVEYLLVADADYFKTLTKATKVDSHLGYVMDCVFETERPLKVIYVPNFRQIFYDPEKVTAKIRQGVEALINHRASAYTAPGADIIHFADYPQTTEAIEAWLLRFLEWDRPLAADIEAFSLKHHTAGVGTISFAWTKHEGIAFPVDLVGQSDEAKLIRAMLRAFFEQFQNKLLWHKITYDVYVLIYQLFMKDILDTEGLLNGMSVLLRDGGWEDTRLIAYLATNSCAGNKLGLKVQAQEFAGSWALDDEALADIRQIPLPELLRYNLVDALSTWHVYEKHYDQMVADQQLEFYETIFKPAVKDIIQMQLTGLPLDMGRVQTVKQVFSDIRQDAVSRMQATRTLQQFTYRLREAHVAKRNSELKKKRISIDDAETQAVEFNPNSGPQLQGLLFDMLGLPVISLTETKQPSVDGDTLEALRHHTKDPDVLEFLDGMLAYNGVNKILTAFIPAFLAAAQGPDGWHYLFGNFNLGGTVSGRLSSSEPNLQNLPSNVLMAISDALLARFEAVLKPFVKKGKLAIGKLIKWCFVAPPGWMLCGLDFASLEDRISALTTKDPQKLKVYTDGYDGHSLRAYAYFGEQMPDIDPNSVASINSIQVLYPILRQDSKAPTFALTYQGTWKTLIANCGFTQVLARSIEASYHELYAVSDQWVSDKLDQACKDGFVTIALGLRLRTPLLKQVIRGTRKTPYEAEAEGRTAGNALGQSWCLLNSRAGSEFMGKVRESVYRLDIKPCAQIHDAGYFLVREDIHALLFANEHLVKAVQWQDHVDIAHDEVKLGGEFSIFYPDWSQEIGIPNGASEAQVHSAIEKHLAALTG